MSSWNWCHASILIASQARSPSSPAVVPARSKTCFRSSSRLSRYEGGEGRGRRGGREGEGGEGEGVKGKDCSRMGEVDSRE